MTTLPPGLLDVVPATCVEVQRHAKGSLVWLRDAGKRCCCLVGRPPRRPGLIWSSLNANLYESGVESSSADMIKPF